jgi:hypothetical protein
MPVNLKLLLPTTKSPTGQYDFVTDCEKLQEISSYVSTVYYYSQLQLSSALRMNGAIHLLPSYSFVEQTGTTLLNDDWSNEGG